MEITAFDLGSRFVGTAEVPGVASNPLVLAMLRLDDQWPIGDDVAWCSAYCNFVAWLLRLPRSKSLGARTWLLVGRPIPLDEARAAFDVVVLKRGTGTQPGASVINAAGHVGFFAAVEGKDVLILGGNQGDRVSIERFPVAHVLGVRRLSED